jgi:hypothetical protein
VSPSYKTHPAQEEDAEAGEAGQAPRRGSLGQRLGHVPKGLAHAPFQALRQLGPSLLDSQINHALNESVISILKSERNFTADIAA